MKHPSELYSIEQFNIAQSALCFQDLNIDDPSINFIAKVIGNNPDVTELDLSGTRLGPEGFARVVAALSNHKQLRVINLKNCRIGGDEVVKLQSIIDNNPSLEVLNLAGNNLTDKGLEHLKYPLGYHPSLRTLNLSNNAMRNDSALVVSKFLSLTQTLKSLDLSQNKISLNGMIILAESLKANQTLLELDLHNNATKYKSLHAARSFAIALMDNHTLESLNLDNALNQASESVILRALLKNNTLSSLRMSVRDPKNLELAQRVKKHLQANKAVDNQNDLEMLENFENAFIPAESTSDTASVFGGSASSLLFGGLPAFEPGFSFENTSFTPAAFPAPSPTSGSTTFSFDALRAALPSFADDTQEVEEQEFMALDS